MSCAAHGNPPPPRASAACCLPPRSLRARRRHSHRRHGGPAPRHRGPRVVRSSLSRVLFCLLSLARARPRRGELRFSRRRPTRRRADCSFSFSFCAGVPGRTGSWAWAGTRRRTGPTACRRWGPTPSPPSSPAAATPSPSATTAACVPFPFPDRCLLFVLVVHFLASFCF